MMLLACALTILVETPVFALWGVRKRDELMVVVSANAVSNLLLNLSLHFVPVLAALPVLLLPEAAVVAAEYCIFRLAFGKRRGLFAVTLGANVLSFCLGLLILPLLTG
jgi:hypothetical protein